MGQLLNLITPLHQRTTRDYLARMQDEKPSCMEVARRYDRDFWDGERRFGYGGYRYDGRWKPVAEGLVKAYQLTQESRILDVGCGKGYLLHEIRQLLPKAEIHGFDLSEYALKNSKEEVQDALFLHRAEESFPFGDKHFDLVLSLTTLHNLEIFHLKAALQEIQRVGRQAFLTVESYRNDQELFHLQCWALTCRSFYTPDAWSWLFEHFGYQGDYEFIYFE